MDAYLIMAAHLMKQHWYVEQKRASLRAEMDEDVGAPLVRLAVAFVVIGLALGGLSWASYGEATHRPPIGTLRADLAGPSVA